MNQEQLKQDTQLEQDILTESEKWEDGTYGESIQHAEVVFPEGFKEFKQATTKWLEEYYGS